MVGERPNKSLTSEGPVSPHRRQIHMQLISIVSKCESQNMEESIGNNFGKLALSCHCNQSQLLQLWMTFCIDHFLQFSQLLKGKRVRS